MTSAPFVSEYAPGDDIDSRYVLRREIGSGGAGRVFEAAHRFTGRAVAVKLVAPTAGRAERAELVQRLVREIRALAGLSHPNIVQALDGGLLPDGTPYLVMELLDGRTLEGVIAARGKLGADDTVAVALQICDALDYAHAAGVVHRDVKPSNVIVTRSHLGIEVAKLLDFGIARVDLAEDTKLTQQGALVGTTAYMSPEQLLAKDDIDARTDIYSLGVTMYECLTGRIPYEGSYPEVLLQVHSDGALPARVTEDREIPADLRKVLAGAIQREREDRFPTIAAFRDALRAARPLAAKQTSLFRAEPAALQKDQRRLPRAPYITPVRLAVGGDGVDGRTEDISTGGVLMICRRECSPGQRGTLRFALPIEGTIVGVEVAVRWARAARADDEDGPRAVGLELLGPPPGVVASIARYVDLMKQEGT